MYFSKSFLIFLVFMYFACSNTQGILAENIQTEEAGITKPERLQRGDVKIFEYKENIRNSNKNVSSSKTIGYATSLKITRRPSTSEMNKSLKLATPPSQHHKYKSREHFKRKHRKMSRKHRHHRKSRRNKNMQKTSKKTMTINPTTITVPESKNHAKEIKKLCSACQSNDEETVKEIRYQMFVKRLADGLHVTPEELMSNNRSKTTLKLPDALLEEALQDSPQDQGTDKFYAEDKKFILPGRDMGRQCISRRTSGCYRFDLVDKVSDHISGMLWVYKIPDRHDNHAQTFFVYMLEKNQNGSVRVEGLIHRHQTNVRDGWVVIPINLRLREEKSKDLMIAVRCATCANKHHRSLYGAKYNYTPLLIVENTSPSHQSRHKRDVEDANCDPAVRCCKKSLEVNLATLGMLLAPVTDIDVGYCQGHCGITEAATNNHTMVVQGVIQSNESANDNLKLCCVPVDFKGRLLFHSSGEEVQTISFNNMFVSRCGCV